MHKRQAHSLEIPLLLDVPIVLPRGGGFSATFPIQQGDECLVVFGMFSTDAWWQSGSVQERFHPRRHSLSDGFAIMGPRSQPRVLENYSTSSMQLRSDDGETVIGVASGQVMITANTVTGSRAERHRSGILAAKLSWRLAFAPPFANFSSIYLLGRSISPDFMRRK